MAFIKINYVCFLLSLNVFIIIGGLQPTLGGQQVPCLFSFGDSLVDNGNNNNLVTTAKVNHKPYGIDFPDGPTGRFCNGRTVIDLLAQQLGFDKFIPPFANTSGYDIMKGVNYGSGGSGIRDETGKNLGDHISFNKQLCNHEKTISRINSLIRDKRVKSSSQEYLSKCLYTVNIGSCDYIDNYFMPQGYTTNSTYTPEQYAEVLVKQYSEQLTTLHKYGARKFALFGLGPIGCLPGEIKKYPTSTCVDPINKAVQLFNGKLALLVDDLNKRLPESKLIYVNVSSILSADPAMIGLQVLNQPCCKVSDSTGLCISGQKPCVMRAVNLFWDEFHPSETVNIFTAKRAYNKLFPWDAYPTDIRHLVQE